jgi:CRISPR system Cascade subunit CasC
MLIELHILQNFAPSNLNRDDTGSPKDCEFGGYRRARISSQCLKRAIRTGFVKNSRLIEDNLGMRTKRLAEELVRQLTEAGKPKEEAAVVAETALKGIKLGLEEGKTQYLVFAGRKEIAAFAALCLQHFETLHKAGGAAAKPGAKTAKEKKKESKDAIAADVQRALTDALNGGKAADLALFGRMLADLPEKNIDAACQVAHAISTNKVSVEFDYYTAIDDLKPEDTAGADMIGTVEFNSACFYRYANIDLGQLLKNLEDDHELAGKALEAFLRSSVAAIPTGKQNSMAAQNPPSFVMAVARHSGLWSLANAFLQPVRPAADKDLVQKSVAALDGYWNKLARMYGDASVAGKWACTLEEPSLDALAKDKVDSVEQLVSKVLIAAGFAAAPRETHA